MNKTIVLAGGSGMLGRILQPFLTDRGYQVVVLSRSARSDSQVAEHVCWDGRNLGDWRFRLEGACAVINLAGRSVNCRYTQRNRDLILNSRTESTRVLGQAIARCNRPPPVWLNSSTATIYKHSIASSMGEAGAIGATREAKDEFSVRVARAWEEAFHEADVPDTRRVALRTAMVLSGDDGSVFDVLTRLVRSGLGGKMASGTQFVSWIHHVDFCRAIEFLLRSDDISGPVNVAAPNPVTNRHLMETLRSLCGVHFGLPATRWMLEVGALVMRTETELIIKSRRVVPDLLLHAGFRFNFAAIREALAQILAEVAVN